MSQNKNIDSKITKIFGSARNFNIIGVLVFSKFFTNSFLSAQDPAVFSWFGLIAIILWGLAYGAVATNYAAVPYLLLVFFVEKMLYTANWIYWLVTKGGTLPSLFAESPLTATFYSVYGAGDFAFGMFFLWVAVRSMRNKENVPSVPA